MSRPLSLVLAAALSVAALMLGAHAAAGAGSSAQAGDPGTTGVTIKGSTIVRLDKVLYGTLTEAGAKVRAGKPATATKTGVKFRVVKVSLGSDGASYLLKHKGSMRISTSSASVTLANPTASISPVTGQGAMTATVAGKRVKIATLQIDIGSLEQTGSGIFADNVVLQMTARLATELNRVLKTNFLTEGTTLGKATINVITDGS